MGAAKVDGVAWMVPESAHMGKLGGMVSKERRRRVVLRNDD